MKTLTVLVSILVGLSAFAADAKFKTIRTDELKKLMNSKLANLAIYDANGETMRKDEGIIPGAKLLSSSKKFDPAKELPAAKDAKLVFYCGNTACTASHRAAERAMEAGYTDVNVFSDGILGWKKAGNPAQKL